MARPIKENKEESKVLSWKVKVSEVELFDKIYKERGDENKVDTLRAMMKAEAKRLKIPLEEKAKEGK